MVSKYNLLINGVYWGYNPLILTIDPNFQRDIQVAPSGGAKLQVSVCTWRPWRRRSPFPSPTFELGFR